MSNVLQTTEAAQRKASFHSGDKYAEALRRASNPQSATNIAIVFAAAQAKGIGRVNSGIDVLTFAAWKAKGRTVIKGQKALCTVVTFFDRLTKDETTGTTKTVKMTHQAAVFHVSQTKAMEN